MQISFAARSEKNNLENEQLKAQANEWFTKFYISYVIPLPKINPPWI